MPHGTDSIALSNGHRLYNIIYKTYIGKKYKGFYYIIFDVFRAGNFEASILQASYVSKYCVPFNFENKTCPFGCLIYV